MRTILTQDHPSNLRELILAYELDKEGNRCIDFTYGKGALWKSRQPYRLTVTKTDGTPSVEGVIKKLIHESDYSDLGVHDCGVWDPPYVFGKRKPFDYPSNGSAKERVVAAQKQGINSWGNQPRFTQNKDPAEFIERARAVNRVASQCIKKGGVLFVKIMDLRFKGQLVFSHGLIKESLTNFRVDACCPYFAGGSHTWTHRIENAHGYWMAFIHTRDPTQVDLPPSA